MSKVSANKREERPLDQFPNTDLSVWLRTPHSELVEPVAGEIVEGKVPDWLRGTLLRNGPGGVDCYGPGSCKHLFDAPGLIQKFQINNGLVQYSTRYIRSKSFLRNQAANRLVLTEFGTVGTPDPCQTIFARVAALFVKGLEEAVTDNANISITPVGDEVYTFSEFPFAHRIDLESLETTNTVNVYEELGVINHSAHPHVCLVKGKLYNMGQMLSLWHGPQYVIAEMDTGQTTDTDKDHLKMDHRDRQNRSSSFSLHDQDLRFQKHVGHRSFSISDTNLYRDNVEENNKGHHGTSGLHNKSPWSSAKVIARLPSRWGLSICYMHSFAITRSYFVLVEQPMSLFLPWVPLSVVRGTETIASCLKFHSDQPTLFHLLPRNSCDKRHSFRAPAFFFLHTINAFEMRDGDSQGLLVVVDICCYDNPSMIDCMYVDALKVLNAHSNPDYAKMFRGRPRRFVLRLDNTDELNVGGTAEQCSQVQSEQIVDIGCETPKINDKLDGRQYNFFYAISSDVDAEQPGTLIKVDVLKKSYDTWSLDNAYPSEPIFVARPNSHREDDGVVLSTIVYGGEAVSGPNNTSLVILSATTWNLVAKVDFQCPTAVPKCLHGSFISESLPAKGEERRNKQITKRRI